MRSVARAMPVDCSTEAIGIPSSSGSLGTAMDRIVARPALPSGGRDAPFVGDGGTKSPCNQLS